MQNGLTSFFGRRVPLLKGGGEGEEFTVTTWAPRVDIAEDDKEYVINAELPGTKKEDVKVSVENGVLSISGERKSPRKKKKARNITRLSRLTVLLCGVSPFPRVVPASRSVRNFGTESLRCIFLRTKRPKQRVLMLRSAECLRSNRLPGAGLAPGRQDPISTRTSSSVLYLIRPESIRHIASDIDAACGEIGVVVYWWAHRNHARSVSPNSRRDISRRSGTSAIGNTARRASRRLGSAHQRGAY